MTDVSKLIAWAFVMFLGCLLGSSVTVTVIELAAVGW